MPLKEMNKEKNEDKENKHLEGKWCGFSSLMKQNKKAKICFVIYIAGEKKLLFYIYAVIVKQKNYKRPSNYY
jgi:hypothetical protein